ncbi:hypothetical protein G6F47_011706 [Rhizopus delemar]|nr:hypothetical protein G6F47_011706 [Rhizopus delemar]
MTLPRLLKESRTSMKVNCTAKLNKYFLTDNSISVDYVWKHANHDLPMMLKILYNLVCLPSSVALCCEEYVEDTEKYLSMYNSIVKRKLNEVKGDVENLDQLLSYTMNRTKAKQSSRFVGTSTLPPRRKHRSNSKRPRSSSPGEGASDNKRKRIQFSDTELDAFFFLSMENKLKESIRTVVRKNNKKMNGQLAALKQKLSTAKKLPIGIITGDAKLAESTYNEPSQADLILRQIRSFMDNRVGKKNEIEWQEFVVKNFDTFKNEETNLAKSAQPESNDTDRDSVPDADRPVVDENSYRTCTASINKLIREDLDPSIKDLIIKKLQRAMIVPSEFHTDSPKYTITPLAMDVSDSLAFNADFSQLFQEQHFSLISTKYFSNRGSQDQTLNEHPIQTALFKLMDAENIKKETFPVGNVLSSLMSLALQIYVTNFKNMWADKIIVNKLLDKLLVILLPLHLAPKRELQRRQNILNYISRKPEEKRPSKSYGRYILRAEKKKLARYKEKVREAEADSELLLKRIRAVKMAETRIRSLEEKFAQDASTSSREKSVESTTTTKKETTPCDDLSRGRISQLKSGAKHLIFSKDLVTEKDVNDEFPDATRKEVSVCLLIINTLKKFVPVRSKYHILPYQLLFCIFANDVLHYAEYSKFTRKLCPAMLSAHVNALNIDAPSLFQIMKSKTDDNQGQVEGMSAELTIYSYNKEPLPSVEIARRNKDAVFNSLFDMEKVRHTCESNGLKFGQRMSVLPKLKVVRILGVKKTTAPPVKLQNMSYLKRILRDPNILREGQKSLEDLKAETAKIEKEVKSLDQEREKALKCQKEQDSMKKIKALRKEWHNKVDKQTLYQRIEEERHLRDKTYLKINDIEDQLMEKKQVLYYQRMAIRHNSRIHIVDTASAPPTTKKELKKDSRGLITDL